MAEPVAVPGVDPSRVNTPDELAACLDGLRRRRDLSYEAMEKAVAKLPPRSGGSRPEPLPKTTVGEIVTGKRLPTKGKLLTFLTVCEVTPGDLAQWLAAWERASTADLARPAGAVRVRDALPRLLGVHDAIQVEGKVPGELPVYVPRDIDDGLRAELAANAQQGCFVLLIGRSSAGKTRTLYEAVLAALPDWWLVHPEDPGAIHRLAEAPTPRTVVWLDELQLYLGPGAGLTAGAVRCLLRAGAVLAATIWPDEYNIRIAPRQPGHDDPHRPGRELLDLAKNFDVADAFTNAEAHRAQKLAAIDRRLRRALDSPDGGLTQVLAAGPQLVRWWEQAHDPYAKATIAAAVDARRLGAQSPVTTRFLASAVHGYLTPAQRARALADWLERALAYATTPLHGAASALSPVDDGTMGRIEGYVAADYLLQHSWRTRWSLPFPASLWQALVDHTTDPDDLLELADGARKRMLYRYAEPLYRHAAEVGGAFARVRLGELLADQDRTDEAINELREAVTADDTDARPRLVKLLADNGRADELRELAAIGDTYARVRLAELLADNGRADEAIAEFREAVTAGDKSARIRLAELLADQGRADEAINELREAVAAGSSYVSVRLAELLADHGRLDEAMNELRDTAVTADDTYDRSRLVDLLARHGRADDLRELAASGDTFARLRLADALADNGRADDLRELAATGDTHARSRLAELLTRHGRETDLRELATTGDTFAIVGLAELLADQGRADEAINELREAAAAGFSFPRSRLPELLAYQGRTDEAINEMRKLTAAGYSHASAWLAELLADHGREADLRELAATGNRYARRRLAEMLARQGRLDEAINEMREATLPRDIKVRRRLAEMLARQGRLDDAINEMRELVATRADYDHSARGWLVDLLADHGREADLRELAASGDTYARSRLADLLATQGRVDDAAALRRCGLNPDGMTETGEDFR